MAARFMLRVIAPCESGKASWPGILPAIVVAVCYLDDRQYLAARGIMSYRRNISEMA